MAKREHETSVPTRDLTELLKTTLRHCLYVDETTSHMMNRLEILTGGMELMLKEGQARLGRADVSAGAPELEELREVLGRALTVSRRSDVPEELIRDYHLDAPVPGQKLPSLNLSVSGWVVGGNSPVAGVELVAPRGQRRPVPLGVERRDLARDFPELAGVEKSGFETKVPVTDLLRDGELLLQALHRDGSVTPLADIKLYFGPKPDEGSTRTPVAPADNGRPEAHEPEPDPRLLAELAALREALRDKLLDNDTAGAVKKELAALRQVVSDSLVVRRADPESTQNLEYALDQPLPGQELEDLDLPLSGWVLGRVSPVTAVDVVAAGTHRRILLSLPRPDIAAAHPEIPGADLCGFETTVPLAELAGDRQVRLEALHADDATTPFAVIALGGSQFAAEAKVLREALQTEKASGQANQAVAQRVIADLLQKLAKLPTEAGELAHRLPAKEASDDASETKVAQALEQLDPFRRFLSEQLTVTRLEDPEDRLLDCHLDAPLPGSEFDFGGVPISGWVLGSSSPVTSIEVTAANGRRWQAPLCLDRPDVARDHVGVAGAATCGFETAIDFFDVFSGPPLLVQAVHADGTMTPICTIDLSTRKPDGSGEAA